MTKYQSGSQADEDFLNKLSEHPELRERFEAILGLARNERGEADTADEAEELAVQEVRRLGQEVLQNWARSKHQGLEKKYDRQAGYRRKEKKTFIGKPDSE